MTHELKIWPCYYEAVLKYTKRFEWRVNDRSYNIGDTLWLREYTAESFHVSCDYTGRSLRVKILYVLLIKDSGSPDHVILSISEPFDVWINEASKKEFK